MTIVGTAPAHPDRAIDPGGFSSGGFSSVRFPLKDSGHQLPWLFLPWSFLSAYSFAAWLQRDTSQLFGPRERPHRAGHCCPSSGTTLVERGSAPPRRPDDWQQPRVKCPAGRPGRGLGAPLRPRVLLTPLASRGKRARPPSSLQICAINSTKISFDVVCMN